MKFFFVILSICCYIISQTTIDARTPALRKPFWSLIPNSDYQWDIHRQKSYRTRQAGMLKALITIFFSLILKILGWGKRRDILTDDEYDELPPYHPFASQDNAARTWFDDT